MFSSAAHWEVRPEAALTPRDGGAVDHDSCPVTCNATSSIVHVEGARALSHLSHPLCLTETFRVGARERAVGVRKPKQSRPSPPPREQHRPTIGMIDEAGVTRNRQ
jgi:hypothetical protein